MNSYSARMPSILDAIVRYSAKHMTAREIAVVCYDTRGVTAEQIELVRAKLRYHRKAGYVYSIIDQDGAVRFGITHLGAAKHQLYVEQGRLVE